MMGSSKQNVGTSNTRVKVNIRTVNIAGRKFGGKKNETMVKTLDKN